MFILKSQNIFGVVVLSKGNNRMIHIALVEDNPILVRFLNDLLVKRGYRVSLYDSGQKAFDEMKLYQPHLAIIDLSLPDMSGLDLIKKYALI